VQLSARQWLILGASVLGGGLVAFWIEHQDEPGTLVDKLTDALVELTSSDESRLEQLQPDTQTQVRALIQALANQGIDVHVGSTLRSSAAEKAAIASGHSSASLKVSWHQLGRAVDLYPIDPDTGKPDLNGKRDDLFQAMVATARAMGFRSLAYEDDGVTRHYIQTVDGPTWDGGHLEWRAPYASITEAVAAEGAAYGLA
jgi:D-alanyl-D-alanine carboxypeptidase